jgi:site-specific DNA recombinase
MEVMRAGLYARVSREEQAEGYSLDEQLDAMRRFCAEQGWAVVAEYVEPGFTARTDDRPVFREVLKDGHAGSFDVLVTHKLDRAFRSLLDQLQRLAQLTEWEVTYVSVVERIDYSTPHGKLFMAQLGALNQYYSDNLSTETRKGKRGRAKKGLSNASTTAYGYRRNEEGLDEIDPEAAQAVILAFESYATGEQSDTDVARMLNRAGYPPSGRARSGKWTREGVRYMLTNRFYTGWVQHDEDWYPGQHEAIISQELFDQVQTLRVKRHKSQGKGRKPHRVYLLARLARCHHCGLRLVSQACGGRKGKRGKQYYTCPATRRAIECAAGGRFVQAEIIDEQVADLVKRLHLPDDWRERLKELSNHQEERRSVEGRRRYLQSKLRRLRELYLDGDFEKAEYNRRKVELQTELDALRMPDQPQIEQAGETLESLGAEWLDAPKRLQHEMLKVIFESVTVDIAGQQLVCVKPHAPFVPLFRMDGLEEKEDGCFYPLEEKVGPES